MGVYIKGIKMPENCSECPVALSGKYCCINKTYTTYIKLPIRPDHCPLVEVPEPHGDLVDKDMLEQEIINGIKAGNLEEGYEHYANINNMDDCVECVKYADTVIEAEGSDGYL